MNQNSYIQYARYHRPHQRHDVVRRTALFSERAAAIGAGTDAREMQVGVVSAGFFGFFDAPPALGRYFTAPRIRRRRVPRSRC